MSTPKEKQFLPERVPVRFGWHKLQPWGLLLCRLSPLGRTVLQVGRVPLADRGQGTPPFAGSPWMVAVRVIRAALLDCCAHLLRGLSEEGPKQAAAPSQGRGRLGVLRPWTGWTAGGRWFGRGM